MAKRRLTTAALILIFLLGLALLLYPSLSNWYNTRYASRVISTYQDNVSELDEQSYAQILLSAKEYNDANQSFGEFTLSPEQEADYLAQLDISGTGIMGYLEIPKLNVSLPIYHGSSEGVLQVAIGHLEWSDLPVGGSDTHCVLTGHRGLPNARLFTDLPDMELGDVFYIQVLDEVLTYEVDQILTVLPNEVEEIMPEEGQDYCTLLTCTPYGINTHRLLVRGHRVANEEAARTITVTADAVRVESLVIAPFIALPILLVLLLIVLFDGRRRKKNNSMRESQ